MKFEYDPPSVTDLSLRSTNSSGEISLTLTGASFGRGQGSGLSSSSVDWGGELILAATTEWDQAQVIFKRPTGVGRRLVGIIAGGVRSASSITFAYAPPWISYINSAPVPTQGGVDITINGANFGQDIPTGSTSVTVGPANLPCTIKSVDHTRIVCTAPTGHGSGVSVSVTVRDGFNGVAPVLTYDRPVVNSVIGCPTVTGGISTSLCPPTATGPRTILTITGRNFGSDITAVMVTVGENECTDRRMITAHTGIECELPNGFGLDVNVTVTCDGLSGSKAALSYASPIFTSRTLSIQGQDPIIRNGIAEVNATSSYGGTTITIQGNYFGDSVPDTTVTYGPLENLSQFNCTVLAVTPTSLTCTTNQGLGANLHFRAIVRGVRSTPSDDVYNYPYPIIIPKTLRTGRENAAGVTTSSGELTVFSTTGEVLVFDVRNIGDSSQQATLMNSLLRVTYGPRASLPFTKVCTIQKYTNTQIQCLTQPGDGTGNVMQVCVGQGTGAACTFGTDTYSVPTGPVLLDVTGCPLTDSVGHTAGCPTNGLDPSTGERVSVTISGAFFGSSGAVVKIGDKLCDNVQHTLGLEDKRLTCLLPASVGLDQAVVVSSANKYSKTEPWLSYAIPTLTRISGCNDQGDVTVDCERRGGNKLTIYGANFGATNSKVLVGGRSCTNVTHGDGNGAQAHSLVTCISPEGSATQRDVILIQDAGELSQTILQVSYKQCIEGTWSNGSSTTCLECGAGTYTNKIGQHACLSCEAGRYNPLTGQTTCLDAEAGKFSNRSGLLSPYVCPIGRFSNVTGSVICQECAPGKRQPRSEAIECIACLGGTYQPLGGQSICLPCPPGKAIATEAQPMCQDCAAGTFNTHPGGRECVVCRNGTYSTSGATICSECAPGTWSVERAGFCQPCPAGRAQPLPGQATCTPCQAGSMSPNTSATQCTPCLPGTAAANDGAIGCEACAAGRYSDRASALSCTLCAAGSYQAFGGRTRCEPCAPGTYIGSREQTGCLPCAGGTISNVEGSTTCSICEVGKRSANLTGSTECVDCEPGRYNAREKGTATCDPCPRGNYTNTARQTRCIPCEPGTYQDELGETTCSPCQAGSSTFDLGKPRCDPCPAGQYQNQTGTKVCVICNPGTFQKEQGQSTCAPCLKGYSCPSSGLISPVPCPAGLYSDREGETTCSICQPGRFAFSGFQGKTGATTCQECLVGYYSARSGQPSCTPCPAGSYQNVTGATTWNLCPIATQQPLVGRDKCDPCPRGTASAREGLANCGLCAPGSAQNLSGQTSCVQCSAGSSQSQSGQAECVPCAPGTFISTGGQATCEPCSKGTFSTRIGRTTQCDQCPAGKHSPTTGATACALCPSGRFTDIGGRDVCSPCKEGYYANITGATTCNECSKGTYQPSTGKESCVVCPAGKARNEVRGTSCTDCEAGHFAPSNGTEFCSRCPGGRYQSNTGHSSCAPTNPGKYTNDGATTEIACQPGFVAPYSGMSACARCIETTANTNNTACMCPRGTFSDTRATDVFTKDTTLTCKTCPVGGACDRPGVTFDNMETAVGYWRADTTTLTFYRCLLPEHCVGGRGSRCGTNREGVLCATCVQGTRSSTGFSECIQCPSHSQAVGVSVFIIFLIAIALFVMYYIVLRSDRRLLLAAQEQDHRRIHWDADDVNETLPDYDALSVRAQPNATYKMKIMLSFIQVCTNLIFIVEVPWPSTYVKFMDAFRFLNLDFVPWQSVGCASSFDFYTKFLVITISPMVVILLIALLYLVPMYYMERKDMSDSDTRRASKKRARRVFMKLALFTAFLMYPSVSSTTLSVFACRDVNGTPYLVADFSIVCGDDKWTLYVGAAVIMTMIYPIGIPLLFFWMLYRYRARLQQPDIRLQLGFLYEAYTHDMWFFELVDMFHKLWMTSLLAFFSPQAQMPVAMVITGLYLIALLVRSPYVRKGDDRLHLITQMYLLIFVTCGWVLRSLDAVRLDSSLDLLTSMLLIFLTLVLILVFLAMAVKNIRKLLRKIQRKQFSEKHTTKTETQRKLPLFAMFANPMAGNAHQQDDDDTDDEDDLGLAKKESRRATRASRWTRPSAIEKQDEVKLNDDQMQSSSNPTSATGSTVTTPRTGMPPQHPNQMKKRGSALPVPAGANMSHEERRAAMNRIRSETGASSRNNTTAATAPDDELDAAMSSVPPPIPRPTPPPVPTIVKRSTTSHQDVNVELDHNDSQDDRRSSVG